MRSSALLFIPASIAVLAACNDSNRAPSGASPDAGASTVDTLPVGCAKEPAQPSALPGSPPTQTTVQHFAPVTVGTPQPFDVPPNTISVTVIEQALTAPDAITEHFSDGSTNADPNTAVPLTIADPTGKIVHDDRPTTDVSDPTSMPSFFASESPATGTVTFPNTTTGLNTPIPAGTWTLLVSDLAYECATANLFRSAVTCDESSKTSTYDVTVITKQAAGQVIPSNGTIDVAFYFATKQAPDNNGVTTRPLTAASAPTDPDLQRMVATLRSIYGAAGIAIGDVAFVDLPDALQTTLDKGIDVDVRGACAALPQLLASASAGNRANVFLVSRLTGGTTSGTFTVVGVDGTIPGPSSVGGTVASGAAVSTEDLRFTALVNACAPASPDFRNCGADTVAYIAAHEIGHFLGLYHTTEQEGFDFDTLSDTAACPCTSCKTTVTEKCQNNITSAAPLHLMTSVECTASDACGGGDNLMFWLFGSKAAGTLSPDQGRVMRANALVH
jgi:hypothetical protein